VPTETENRKKAEKPEQIDLLYDSECPICMMEVEFLSKRDIDERIKFTDLQSPDYDPEEHGNVQFSEGMRKIRAVLPDGEVVKGVEVFRRTYDAIGLGWVFGMTNLPIIGGIADKIYDMWAENRLRLTGQKDLAQQLKERQARIAAMEPIDDCDVDACGIDWDDDFEED
jgi:predicted DCC family thiol-disulfide oxidoreductase YuxK